MDLSKEQVKVKVVEHPVLDESTGFDYRVHIKDAKTGRLVRVQHYARHSKGDKVLLERPIGSGNCFHENGNSAGRWEFKQVGQEEVWSKLGDEHIIVKQASEARVEDLIDENAALQAELEALRAEAKAREPQSAPKAQKI